MTCHEVTTTPNFHPDRNRFGFFISPGVASIRGPR